MKNEIKAEAAPAPVDSTPGPWNYRDGVEATYQVYASHSAHPGTLSRSEEPIAEIPRPDNDDRGYAEAEANARLIAAAPALLAALKMFAFNYAPTAPEMSKCRDVARAAIELAEGGDK